MMIKSYVTEYFKIKFDEKYLECIRAAIEADNSSDLSWIDQNFYEVAFSSLEKLDQSREADLLKKWDIPFKPVKQTILYQVFEEVL